MRLLAVCLATLALFFAASSQTRVSPSLIAQSWTAGEVLKSTSTPGTCTSAAVPIASPLVFRNGLLQKLHVDFEETGTSFIAYDPAFWPDCAEITIAYFH